MNNLEHVMEDNTLLCTKNDFVKTLPLKMVSKQVVDYPIKSLLQQQKDFDYTSNSQSFETNSNQDKKVFAVWVVVFVLWAFAVGNLVLSCFIVGVLRLGKGIQGMELITTEGATKFYGVTDMEHVYTKAEGKIEGFYETPVEISGDSSINLRFHRNNVGSDRIQLDKEGLIFKTLNTFEIKDTAGRGTNIFTTHRPQYNIAEPLNSLLAKIINVNKISSPIGESLEIEANGIVFIKGSEGVILDSLSVLFESENNIVFSSSEANTIIEANGIHLDVDKLPIVNSEFGLRTVDFQYKICVCIPKGTLYRIEIPRIHNGPKISCANYNPKHTPCFTN